MGKIVYLMGKSCAGKNTVFQKLLEEEIHLKTIIPYTTRPIRAGETDGVEYHFTDEAGFRQMERAGRVIESRTYHTAHGKWIYFTAADETIDLERHSYLMIGTLDSFVQVKEYFGVTKLLPVMIELDDGKRLQRALERERSQETPRYEEMCRRFLADSEDFRADKVADAGVTKTFSSHDLSGCLAQIRAYMRQMEAV
ncbi:MAG: 50S ribosome-binding GTPase [Clostridium sp.]|jgi:guanylate kinase|nr:50S ribosome-binding GTPase [Clostridium sp.]